MNEKDIFAAVAEKLLRSFRASLLFGVCSVIGLRPMLMNDALSELLHYRVRSKKQLLNFYHNVITSCL